MCDCPAVISIMATLIVYSILVNVVLRIKDITVCMVLHPESNGSGGPAVCSCGPPMWSCGPSMWSGGPIMWSYGPAMWSCGPFMWSGGPAMWSCGPVMWSGGPCEVLRV